MAEPLFQRQQLSRTQGPEGGPVDTPSRSGPSTDTTVPCWNCGALNDVGEAFAVQVRGQVEAELVRENRAVRDAERQAIREEEAERARTTGEIERQDLVNQLDETRARESEGQEAQLALRSQVRQLKRAAEENALAATTREDEIRDQANAEAEERYAARMAAKDQQLARVQHEADELRRKASTGSPQNEGLAQQQLFGEALRTRFPSDHIEVIRQGKAGADVRQVVCDQAGRNAGVILYETKWAQQWSTAWPEKLRLDQQRAGAHVGVLVSAALPKGADPVSQTEGVWLCDFGHALLLAFALRDGLFKIARYEAANAAREGTAVRVFDYVATGVFADRVVSMVRTLSGLRDGLAKEQRFINQAWSAREKQHQSIEAALAAIVGDLVGLEAHVPQAARFDQDMTPALPPEAEANEIEED
jgi:hypothetical protein